jgi:hypothetical protein
MEGHQLFWREGIPQLPGHVFEWFANVLCNGCLIRQRTLDNAAQGILKGQRDVAP